VITPVVLVCNDEYWLPYALEASKGFFDRYVIYDVGSTDRTREIIQWFMDTAKAQFYVRMLPMVPPAAQGAFRNSMIAEALNDWYFILDGDEVYTPEGYEALVRSAQDMRHQSAPIYGVVERVEVGGTLDKRYISKARVPHHRVYHRHAIWTGSHPGEVPFFKQTAERERWIEGAICYHFHNCERSSKDAEVPKRLERRGRPTYRPGELVPFDLFETLPIMKMPIESFAVCLRLAELQSGAV